MQQIKIYEPAMCCASGICGVGVDNELLRITTKVNKMKEDGILIERFNLSASPQAFIENKTVQQMIAKNGVDILPIVVLNDKVVITGRYPTNIELDNLTNASTQSTQNFEAFQPNAIPLTKYLFFTGKGGVGKTSMACATAVQLADSGKHVLLISTDPASNLQDVFETELNNTGVKIDSVPNLTIINLNPIEAANAYKESVLAPYKNLLPKEVLNNMEEQLSGSCTVEIAAFNEFANFLTDEQKAKEFDFILFDTAPTGHTLRMLQLPSAWNDFIQESSAGVNCLGQLSGLGNKKAMYEKAVKTLSNKEDTTLILVTRPDIAPLQETERASKELSMLHIDNQIMIINGILESYDDTLSKSLYLKQQTALSGMSPYLKTIKNYAIPLRAYNITGVDTLRKIFTVSNTTLQTENLQTDSLNSLDKIIEDIYNSNKKVIFTMGKGGVGKTTIAAAIALGLSKKGKKIHLTTTDPADHLKFVMDKSSNIELSHIDEKEELEKYKLEVLSKAKQTMSSDDIAYIEEDLKSPCTQEIAVFRRFAEIVNKADDSIIVIDTAPTGHTLLLLESTQSYNKEIQRTSGTVPKSVVKLLPRLKDANETEVIIITLPETTPVYEAMRLQEDLQRAGIANKWWIINQSLLKANSTNAILQARATNEIKWINQVNTLSSGHFAIIPWQADEIKGLKLLQLL